MKLSQAICISLTLLICFSPTLSLGMEYQELEIDNALDGLEVVNIDIDADQQISLADKLKNKNIPLFKQIDEVKKRDCSKICNASARSVKNFFKKYYYFLILPTTLLITLLLTDPWPYKNEFRFFIYAAWIFNCIMWLNIFLQWRTRKLMIKIDNQDQITDRDLFLVDLNSGIFCFKQAIIYTAQKNKLEIVKKLLTKWSCVPDVTTCCNSETALDHAYNNKNVEMIKCLLKHPEFVNFDVDDFLTRTFIEFSNEEEIIELLFDKGGRIKIEDLGKIIQVTSVFFVQLLVDLGVDLNEKDIDGTPLFMLLLLRNGRMLCIDSLLAKNIDFGLEDAEGKTVFDYLNERPEIEGAQLIIEKFKLLRKRISDQIYTDLAEYQCEGFAQGFPKVQANLIAEYLV